MPKRHHKSAHLSAKAAAPRTPKAPSTTPVEAAWLKFADKFRAFQRTPNNDDKENDRPWEAALNVANRAAYAVIAEPATCLHDMELRIQACAFQAAVEKGDGLTDLANWQPHLHEQNSEFIASLRDDVLAMSGLCWQLMSRSVRSLRRLFRTRRGAHEPPTRALRSLIGRGGGFWPPFGPTVVQKMPIV
jgi:hypothetical protein